MEDAHDDRRGDSGINHVAARRAEKHPLPVVRLHGMATAAAELIVLVPAEKVVGGDPCKGRVLGHGRAENTYILEGVAGKRGDGRRRGTGITF